MPLLTCPDCNGSVSDAAISCPGCGRPLFAGGFVPQGSPAQPSPGTNGGGYATATSVGQGDADTVGRHYDARYDTPVGEADEGPHPWRRYWARLIDTALAAFCLGMVFFWDNPNAADDFDDSSFVLLVLFLWNFVEAAFLALWATTPGKGIFRIRVRTQDGRRLGYGQALVRAFSVWFRGMGMGIPFITVITNLVARHKLLEHGETTWDANGDYRVHHAHVSGWRWAVLVFIVGALFILTMGSYGA